MAAKRVVSLTAHRNTLERRKRKQRREAMMAAAHRVACSQDMLGWMVVGFDKHGVHDVEVNTEETRIPDGQLPDMVKQDLAAVLRGGWREE